MVLLAKFNLPGLKRNQFQSRGKRKRTQDTDSLPSTILISENYMEKIIYTNPQNCSTLYSVEKNNTNEIKKLLQDALVREKVNLVVNDDDDDAESVDSNPRSSTNSSKERIDLIQKNTKRSKLSPTSSIGKNSSSTKIYILVDNNSIGNRFVVELLQDFNYAAKQYDSAIDAFSYVKERQAKIDIVLRCLSLPGLIQNKQRKDMKIPILSMSFDYISKVLVSSSPEIMVNHCVAKTATDKDVDNVLQYVFGWDNLETTSTHQMVLSSRVRQMNKDSVWNRNSNMRNKKKSSRINLEGRFKVAIKKLMHQYLTPKEILNEMNMDGVTDGQVVRLLQKFYLNQEQSQGLLYTKSFKRSFSS